MACQHLARGAGVLAIGFVVEIAPADRRDVEERRQTNKKDEECASHRRRLDCSRREKNFVEPEGRIARRSHR